MKLRTISFLFLVCSVKTSDVERPVTPDRMSESSSRYYRNRAAVAVAPESDAIVESAEEYDDFSMADDATSAPILPPGPSEDSRKRTHDELPDDLSASKRTRFENSLRQSLPPAADTNLEYRIHAAFVSGVISEAVKERMLATIRSQEFDAATQEYFQHFLAQAEARA